MNKGIKRFALGAAAFTIGFVAGKVSGMKLVKEEQELEVIGIPSTYQQVEVLPTPEIVSIVHNEDNSIDFHLSFPEEYHYPEKHSVDFESLDSSVEEVSQEENEEVENIFHLSTKRKTR